PMISLRFYGFNTRIKPLDDRRVRQALNYAIDRDAILQAVHLGRYTLARGILPPGTQGFNPRLGSYGYDPDRARDLLARAGYPEGRGLPPIAVWSSVKRDEVVPERDLFRRVDLYRRAEQMILDDAPLLPVLHHTHERLFQPYVRAVEVNGLGDPYIPLRRIRLERAP